MSATDRSSWLHAVATDPNPDIRVAAAADNALPEDLELALARDPNLRVRLALARSGSRIPPRPLSTAALRLLARDKSVQVRRALARQNLPGTINSILIKDEDQAVRTALVDSTTLTIAQRVRLATDSDVTVRIANATWLVNGLNRKRPAARLVDALLTDPSPAVRAMLLTAVWIQADDLLALARDPHLPIRRSLAASNRLRTHQGLRDILLRDPHRTVRATVAQHAADRALSHAEETLLASDPSADVRAALARATCNAAVLQALLEDQDVQTRTGAADQFLDLLSRPAS